MDLTNEKNVEAIFSFEKKQFNAVLRSYLSAVSVSENQKRSRLRGRKKNRITSRKE